MYEPDLRGFYTCNEPLFVDRQHDSKAKRRSEGYLFMLLVHGFLVLRESRHSFLVDPVQLVTLYSKVTCTGMNGVEILTRVPRRHGKRHW